jgi:hypothetical protein
VPVNGSVGVERGAGSAAEVAVVTEGVAPSVVLVSVW